MTKIFCDRCDELMPGGIVGNKLQLVQEVVGRKETTWAVEFHVRKSGITSTPDICRGCQKEILSMAMSKIEAEL